MLEIIQHIILFYLSISSGSQLLIFSLFHSKRSCSFPGFKAHLLWQKLTDFDGRAKEIPRK